MAPPTPRERLQTAYHLSPHRLITSSPYSAYLPSLLPSYLPLHQSPSLLQAAEAAHEARLHEATQGLEAELRALEAASLSSEARHV